MPAPHDTIVGRPLTIHCHGPLRATLDPPGTAPELPHEGVCVYVATLSELSERAAHHHTLLDQQEQDRLLRFKFSTDKERFLLGHGFLREVLGRHLHVAPASIVYERGIYGKPVVPGGAIHFNLSDTKDAVAVAVSRSMELGVDIETMHRTVDHVRVGQHYFTPDEQRAIAEAPDAKHRFLEFWTRKEAILKASGVGIMDDLRVLRVDARENTMTITHEAFVAMAAPTYHVHTWHVGEDRLLSLAMPQQVKEVRLFGGGLIW